MDLKLTMMELLCAFLASKEGFLRKTARCSRSLFPVLISVVGAFRRISFLFKRKRCGEPKTILEQRRFFYVLISTSTPAGRFNVINASIVFSDGPAMSISRL